MGIYQSIKCPYCNYLLSFGLAGFLPSRLGVPFFQCPKCDRFIKTDLIPYSEMKTNERFKEIFWRVIEALLFVIFVGFMLTGFTILGLSESGIIVLKNGNMGREFKIFYPIISILIIFAMFYKNRYQIRKAEEEYEKLPSHLKITR